MKIFLKCLTLLIFLTKIAAAGPYFNLDFENFYKSPQIPVKWNLTGTNYYFSADSLQKISGKYSLKIENHDTISSGYFLGSLEFPAAMAAGKKFTLTGYIRTDSLNMGWAGLFIRADNRDSTTAFNNMHDYGPKGSTDWKRYTVTIPVDSNTEELVFGVLMAGSGKAYFDSLSIYLDDESFPDTYPTLLPDSVIATLSEKVIPINEINHGNGLKDLDFLKKELSDARIVALGDVSYGTSETAKLKKRLAEYLSKAMGFNTLAIEANMAESEIINNYTIRKTGTPEEVLENLLIWNMNTKEMLDCVKWIRGRNDSTKNKLRITGYDVQFADAALSEMSRFVIKNNQGYLPLLDSITNMYYSVLDFKSKVGEDYPIPILPVMNMRDQIDRLTKGLMADKKNYIKNIGEEEFNKIELHLRLLDQWSFMLMNSKNPAVRDSLMYENVLYTLSKNPKSKMIILGSNSHLRKSGYTLGRKLSDHFGNSYLSIAFATNEGYFTAIGDSGLAAYRILPAYNGSYEHIFNLLNLPAFYLNLNKLNDDETLNWIASPMDFRMIGTRADYSYYYTRLQDEFDGIIFINKTSNSKLLK